MEHQEISERAAGEIIEASKAGPQYLLVSTSFYELKEHNAFPRIQLDVYCRFTSWIDQFSRELGAAKIYSMGWGDFPEELTGLYLATWEKDGRRYELELQHEDRECPLIIVFRLTAA
ncbi:MAG: hypothetical protein K8R36_00485 [Planctomycetales bacterium]|nr:hypothetical protein [Planctomycetales bacterium]